MSTYYWHRLMEEFINRHAPDMQHYYLPTDEEARPSARSAVSVGASVRIELKDGRYLTQREAQCVHLLRSGCTMREVALRLNLSPRTIEYYLMRVKERWACRTKKELLHLLDESDFVAMYAE